MPKCLEHTEDDHAAAVTEVDGVGSKNWLRMRGGCLNRVQKILLVALE